MDHYCASPSKKQIGRGTLLSWNQASTICLRAATCRKFVTEIAYGRFANVKLRKWRNAEPSNLDVAPCRSRKREFRLVDEMSRGCSGAHPALADSTYIAGIAGHVTSTRGWRSDAGFIWRQATKWRSVAITFSATSRAVAITQDQLRVCRNVNCSEYCLPRREPAGGQTSGFARTDDRELTERAERASAASVANSSSVGAIPPAPKRGKLPQICGRSNQPGGGQMPAGGQRDRGQCAGNQHLQQRPEEKSNSAEAINRTVPAVDRLAREFLPSAERSCQQPAQREALCFNRFPHHRLVAPDDICPLSRHPYQQVPIFAGAQPIASIERARLGTQRIAAQQNVAKAHSIQRDARSALQARKVVKATAANPQAGAAAGNLRLDWVQVPRRPDTTPRHRAVGQARTQVPAHRHR